MARSQDEQESAPLEPLVTVEEAAAFLGCSKAPCTCGRKLVESLPTRSGPSADSACPTWKITFAPAAKAIRANRPSFRTGLETGHGSMA